MDRYDEMRSELMAMTLKDLKRLAKAEGISLGYDASRKDSAVGCIVSNMRYREANGYLPESGDWHEHGVTAFRGLRGGAR